jgi:hypothetical protein
VVANIGRGDLRTRLDRGDPVILLEVLAPQYYRHSHLPGALNLPPGKVAELRKQRHAGQLPNAVVGHHERLTAGLGASVGPQLLFYGRKLLVYVLDHRQR